MEKVLGKWDDPSSSLVTSLRMSFCGWFSGEKFRDHFEKGIYVCSNCGNELFHSQTKYEHSSPWPAFTHLIREDSVTRVKESSTAIKISCSKCGNGLGHEFLGDGPKKGMNRYWIFSASLKFQEFDGKQG